MNLREYLRNHVGNYLGFLIIFLAIYFVLLSINLSYMSMQWDEVSHFTGGLLLIRGQFWEYFLTSSFYPPVFNLVTGAYFAVAGASVMSGRLVAVTFSILSIFVVYQFARKAYGSNVGLVSAVLFAIMPGIVWVSRMAMIETMLIFIFSLSIFFFYSWLQTNRERDRILTIVAIVLGVIVKYQMLVVAPTVMLAGMYFWKREYLKAQIKYYLNPKFLMIYSIAGIVALVVLYELFAAGLLQTLIYSIQVGTAERSIYSFRFPVPIFYFVEMVWPYSNMHPISLFLYILGLLGLGLLVYRRKAEDRYLLLWFLVIYVVFTLIPNRSWRYVTPLFPVIAISASLFIVKTLQKAQKTWKNASTTRNKHLFAKIGAVFLIAITTVGSYNSVQDAYSWVNRDQIQVPIEQATNYAGQKLEKNQSILVVFPLNYLNEYMVWFYLNAKGPSPNEVWQFPKLAVDSFASNLNTSELIVACQQRDTKYIFLYENGETTYFDSNLTSNDVYNILNNTGRFAPEKIFGNEPHRIFVMSFR